MQPRENDSPRRLPPLNGRTNGMALPWRMTTSRRRIVAVVASATFVDEPTATTRSTIGDPDVVSLVIWATTPPSIVAHNDATDGTGHRRGLGMLVFHIPTKEVVGVADAVAVRSFLKLRCHVLTQRRGDGGLSWLEEKCVGSVNTCVYYNEECCRCRPYDRARWGTIKKASR